MPDVQFEPEKSEGISEITASLPLIISQQSGQAGPFTVGRSNWHIIDTARGAQASARICSLVETAKADNLKLYAYLNHLLAEIPRHMKDTSPDFLEALLPRSAALP